MLALKASQLGIPVAILSENQHDPAAQVTSLWTQGKTTHPETLRSFLLSCSLVTFESEFMDANLLEQMATDTKTPIYPRPAHMGIIQDRLSQKELLNNYNLPTSPFVAVHDEDSARAAFAKFMGRVVFKKRRFGYDGYGTFVVKNQKDLKAFLHELQQDQYGFIGEQFIPFRRELAVMVARSKKGSAMCLPFVETHQANSRCLWVKGPLKSSTSLKRLSQKLCRFVSELEYTGIMGVELFDTGREILINELAPRVHNSAHYSMNALSDDQFTLHLKAVLGCELQPPRLLSPGFAMMNLLGDSQESPKWTLSPEIHFHWYGKQENRKGRKMGHINALGKTPDEALKLARKHRKDFKL